MKWSHVVAIHRLSQINHRSRGSTYMLLKFRGLPSVAHDRLKPSDTFYFENNFDRSRVMHSRQLAKKQANHGAYPKINKSHRRIPATPQSENVVNKGIGHNI